MDKDKKTAPEWRVKKEAKLKKDVASVIIIAVFCFILLSGFLFVIFMPKPTESVYEKRALAAFPEFSAEALFSGEYTKALNTFIADTFPFRDGLVSAGVYFDEVKGIRRGDIKIYGAAPAAPVQEESPAITLPPVTEIPVITEAPPSEDLPPLTAINEETPPPMTEPEPEEEEEDVTGEQRGNVFVVGDTGMELFGGLKSAGERYAAALNGYRSVLPEDINIYNILIPTSSEFALPKKYQSMASSQKDAIDHINSFLTDDIIKVNIYDALKEHSKDEYCYFRTDHHWTALGAYYAYLEFAAAAGIEPTPMEDFEVERIEEYLGSFYTSTQDLALKENPDYIESFRPPNIDDYKVTHYLDDGSTYNAKLIYSSVADITSGYIIFIGGDQPYTKIESPNKNGRRLIVFKESYGNAFIPFLAPHYEEIHVADIRYFPYNAVDFINQNGINDVIFINNAFAAHTAVRIEDIEELMTTEGMK